MNLYFTQVSKSYLKTNSNSKPNSDFQRNENLGKCFQKVAVRVSLDLRNRLGEKKSYIIGGSYSYSKPHPSRFGG